MSLKSDKSIFRTEEDSLLIIDPSLESGTASADDLLLFADGNLLNIALFARKPAKILAFEQFALNDSSPSLESSSELIQRFEFKKVKVASVSNQFTFIPDALFKENNCVQFFRLNCSTDPSCRIYSDHIERYRLHTVYGLTKEDSIASLFKQSKTYHHTSPLLNAVSFLSTGRDVELLLNVRSNAIDLIFTQNKSLLLANSFSVNTPEDALYYSLFTLEQLGLNPDKLPVIISGDIENHHPLHKVLGKYFGNLSFLKNHPAFSAGYGIEKISFHRHLLLYSLSLCE